MKKLELSSSMNPIGYGLAFGRNFYEPSKDEKMVTL